MEIFGLFSQKLGRWWNGQEEIDLVAFSEDKIAFIECKWQSKPVSFDVLENLKRKSEIAVKDSKAEKVFVLFSKSGFSENVVKSGTILCR